MSVVNHEADVSCGRCGKNILGKIAVARWYPDGSMIPGTLEFIPAAPHSLANAAVDGKYAECDTQKRTFETNPMECRECGRIDGVRNHWCNRCYVENKL